MVRPKSLVIRRYDRPKPCFDRMNRDQTCSAFSLDDTLSLIGVAGFVNDKQEVDKFFPKVEEAGLCKREESFVENHIFVCARKSGA